MTRTFVLLGSLAAFVAVALGALGAHALQPHLSARSYTVFNTAVQYHQYHALALILVGLTGMRAPDSHTLRWSGWLLFWGMVAFSGSLYMLAIYDLRWLGIVTPFGGMALMFGWIMFAITAWRHL